MNAKLTAMCHGVRMAAISGIEAAGAYTPPRDQDKGRAAADYGQAVSHRDQVRENHRVDPTALAEKKRQTRAMRRDDAADERRAEAQERRERRRVDIRV
jgi:hypothetical protein